MTEGTCGSLTPDECLNARSEGVVFRYAADGSVAEENTISDVQYGIFLNGGNRYRIKENRITGIDGGGSAIQLNQDITDSLIERNVIVHGSVPDQACGIFEFYLGNAGNRFIGNSINDAYCGVVHVSGDAVEDGHYLNTLYDVLDANLFPGHAPPPVEPN
jgi:nitrous oxidase accessory protein NosD